MANFLRTCTPEGDWRSFKFTNPSSVNYLDGKLYLVQDTVGVVLVAQKYDDQGCPVDLVIEPGEEGVLIYHAEKIMLEKMAGSGGSVWVPGEKVFWSGVGGSIVTNEYLSGYYWIGICVEAAAATDERVKVDLKGDKATLTHPL